MSSPLEPGIKKDLSYILEELERETSNGDVESVVEGIKQHDIPSLLLFHGRNITGVTPLHVACSWRNVEVVKFLLEEEEKTKKEQVGGRTIPSYNVEDSEGHTPLFYTRSSTIVELLLKYDDLEVSLLNHPALSRYFSSFSTSVSNHLTLLWHCANKGIVTETIASDERLRDQYGLRYEDKLPLEQALMGKLGSNLSSCIALARGILQLPFSETRLMNLRLVVQSKWLQDELLDEKSSISADERRSLKLELVCAKLSKSKIDHKTLLQLAASQQDKDAIDTLLGIPDLEDEPTDDGLTGFAVSLALKDKDIVSKMLKSDLPTKDDMLFLAQEVLKLSPMGDELLGQLQQSINLTLTSLGIEFQRSAEHFPREVIQKEKFPYVNSGIEYEERFFKNKTWQKRERNTAMGKCMVPDCGSMRISFLTEGFQHLALGKFCIEPASNNGHTKWDLDGVKLLPCSHKEDRKYDCHIIQDLISISSLLGKQLSESNDLMKSLKPRFTLVGSTQEGSRIGIGNEIDVTMHFQAWEENPPFEISGDAFHLHKSDACPRWMDVYFDSKGQFIVDTFSINVCQAVSTCLDVIFEQNQNPIKLTRFQKNEDYLNNVDAKKIGMTSKMSTTSKVKTTSKGRQPQSGDILKNEDDLKNENDLQN